MADDAGAGEEISLVVAARAGDAAAFLRLADLSRPRLLRFLARQLTARDRRRVDLDELAQRALDRAYEALPHLRDPARFQPWLFTIARRLLLDELTERERFASLDTLATLATPPTTPLPAFPGDLPAALADLLEEADLGAEVETMLWLRAEGDSVAEIAAQLGKTPVAVERALGRARRRLRILRARGQQPRGGPAAEEERP